MPSVHIWIRKEDEDFWQQIEDKPSFIHDAIRVQRNMFGGSMYTRPKAIVSSSQYSKIGEITEAYLEEQFEKAGGERDIEEIIITPPEETA